MGSEYRVLDTCSQFWASQIMDSYIHGNCGDWRANAGDAVLGSGYSVTG